MEKKLLRHDDVLEMTSMTRSTLGRRVKTGEFPAPFKLGGPTTRAVRWLRVEVDEWIANLVRTRSV